MSRDMLGGVIILGLIMVAVGFLGYSLYQANTPERWFSLKITHDGTPIQNVDVSLCARYCDPHTWDFRQVSTDSEGIATVRMGFMLIPSSSYDQWAFHFTVGGTGYQIKAVEHQQVDDPI